MSKLFGPVLQQGYVVPDIDAAIKHWLARGVGPFFISHLKDYPAIVDGKECELELKAGFAYSGEQQIEVIEPMGDEPSIYSEYLETHPDGGLQHLALWVDDIEGKLAELKELGLDYQVRQRYGEQHAYIDSKDQPGVMMQLMARNEMLEQVFAIFKDGADTWDGKTDPLRQIDFSSGKAEVRAA